MTGCSWTTRLPGKGPGRAGVCARAGWRLGSGPELRSTLPLALGRRRALELELEPVPEQEQEKAVELRLGPGMGLRQRLGPQPGM